MHPESRPLGQGAEKVGIPPPEGLQVTEQNTQDTACNREFTQEGEGAATC